MKKALVTFMVALFATVFVFGQTKTEVKPADLPKTVTDYVMQNMKGSTIDKAFKMDNKGEITYKVIVMTGKEKQVLQFEYRMIVKKAAKPAGGKKVEPKK